MDLPRNGKAFYRKIITQMNYLVGFLCSINISLQDYLEKVFG